MTNGHPADLVVDDLVGAFHAGATRLRAIVTAALRRGLNPARVGTPTQRRGDATAAFRQQQLYLADNVLRELAATGRRLGPAVVHRSFAAGLHAIDTTLPPADRSRLATARTVVGDHGRLHVATVQALAGQLTTGLTAAVERTGQSVDDVFRRAQALDGPLPASGRLAAVQFLGRRVNDPFRAVALRTLTAGAAALDTRPERSAALELNLQREGVTDALTGFVDRTGRRWPLDTYTAMVARTTTREAMTAGTVGRIRERGDDLITIPSHPHAHDACSPYDGGTFSLSGRDTRYPRILEFPPFHPNCLHVAAPATDSLDDFEANLAAAAAAFAQGDRPVG